MSGFVPFNRKGRRGIRDGVLRPFNMIDDFFDETLGEMPFFKRGNFSTAFRVDIRENENNYVVEADLPGVKKEELDVKLSRDGELTITVNRAESVDEENEAENYIHRERRYESMRRTMYLDSAKPDGGMRAKLNDGVLTIEIEKGDKETDDSGIKIDIE